jgi:hypothetical protein
MPQLSTAISQGGRLPIKLPVKPFDACVTTQIFIHAILRFGVTFCEEFMGMAFSFKGAAHRIEKSI